MLLRMNVPALARAAVGAVLLAGCGGGGGGPELPEPTTLSLDLTAAEKLNTCGEDFSNALVVRVYQLSSDSKISITDLQQLWGNESSELGDDLLRQEELVLEPGAERNLDILVMPEAEFVAVVGNFCETSGDCWRWLGAMDGKSSRTTLVFKETCVEMASN